MEDFQLNQRDLTAGLLTLVHKKILKLELPESEDKKKRKIIFTVINRKQKLEGVDKILFRGLFFKDDVFV
jgi:hypothetical protein